MVLGQEDTFLAPGQKKEVAVLGFIQVGGIKPEDSEPLGQLSQHAIDDEFHRPRRLLRRMGPA
jgi:hypothetical protein